MKLRNRFWKDIFSGLKSAGRGLLGRRTAAAPEEDLRRSCRALLDIKGEASSVALARQALDAFAQLEPAGHADFFEFLRADLGPDRAALETAVDRYRASPDDPDATAALTAAAEPLRQELLLLMNSAPEGTQDLLRMREALLGLLPERPELRIVDDDFVRLFRSWFNRGFLELHRIDWRTPALVLEKIIEYEAVHQILDWDDLRRRLQADRRCFGFFHPALPDEPIIFVEVALCKGLAGSVTDLIHGEVEANIEADTAIFYSISNCQRGLTGISFGNFLIKQVVRELAAEFPELRTFSTLSPVPGLRKWLMRAAREERLPAVAADGDGAQAAGGLGAWLSDPIPDELPAPELRERLVGLCAHYLLNEKRGAHPIDPVARFHLRNGARLERINWRADASPAGLAQSAGLMVNYVYDEAEVVANHEAFVNEGRIAHSAEVATAAAGAGIAPAPENARAEPPPGSLALPAGG